jgi:large conductance mechanosensitive channel
MKIKTLEAFKKFMLRGNLIDMAIGFTVGAAFSTVAKSLVTDIIMPPIGLLMGQSDFADKYIVLKQGSEEIGANAPLAAAQASGAVTLNYGVFINNVLALLLVGLAMFFIVKMINRIESQLDERFSPGDDGEQPANKKCKYCRSTIDYQATRCPNCTSDLTSTEESAPASS